MELRIALVAIVLRGSTALANDVAPLPTPPVDQPRVALDVSGCPADFAMAVRRIVGVEIGDLLGAPDDPASNNDRLWITCDGSIARIAADASRATGHVDRMLSLADFPVDAAPRALALAGIEALATLSPAVRQRIGTHAHPVASPAPTNTAPAPVIAVREPPLVGNSSRNVTLSGIGRWFPTSTGITLWGGRVGVDQSLGPRFNLGLDLDAVVGDRPTPAGNVGGILLSGGASLGLRGQWSRTIGVVSVGARGGIARLVGHAADAASVAGASAVLPWAGPLVSGRILVGWGRLVAGATLETGMAVLAAKGTANGDTVLAINGFWLAASVGAGIRY